MINPKQVYEKFIKGDKLSDEEVIEGKVFFLGLADDLHSAGPVFGLAANEARRVGNSLEQYAMARRHRDRVRMSI